MSVLARTYHGAESAAGPLIYLRRTARVVAGELVTIEQPGQPPRRGQVIDAGEEITVVQVLEETIGLSPSRTTVTLTGDVASVVVGRELLGRRFNGMGQPLDGLAAPIGEALRPIWSAPLNPARRARPTDFIETGISAIDGMNTLVRGQKLPVFSGPGLPALELASDIVEGARAPKGEPFAVVFAGIGITAREAEAFLARFEQSGVAERSVLFLNEARDPTIERLLAPRVALAQAEFLAFDAGMQVLVVIADMAHYCEALREIATAREEIPGRRGYPGYMYTDLASIYERAGIIQGRPGSVTQIPIITMPDDDISHPIPDLTGYITEGQIVMSRELHRRGIFPPVDVLPSLSRLMNAGIGEGKTVKEHREWSDQLYAVYARGREARLMAAIVGEAGLAEPDRRALGFAQEFEDTFVRQPGRRNLGATIEAGWGLLDKLPREDLVRISDETWAAPGGKAVVSDTSRLLPTRLNLLRATRRLERVTKGAALLRRKREALVSALFKLARPAAEARRQIEVGSRRSYDLLLRALALHGRTGLEALAWPSRDLELTIDAGQVWGVPVATIVGRPPIARTVTARGVAPGSAGPVASAAAAEFEKLTELLLDAATREMLMRRLGEALSQTSRQVHTLERRVAPRLESQMAGVRRTLEEREREEHLRLKHLSRAHSRVP